MESVSLSVQGLAPNEIGYLYEILLQVGAGKLSYFHIFIFSYSKFSKICCCNGGISSSRNNNLYFQIINIVWPSVLDPVMYSRRKKEIKTGCDVIQFKVYTIVSISRIYSSASIDFWNLLIIFFIWLNSLFSNPISW